MSKWGKLITTKQGKTALSQAITDNKLVFTSVKTSDLSHSEEVEQLNSIIQTVNAENVSNVDGTISVNVRIDNSNLEVGYHIKTIGLYARLENENEEFLYAYCVSNKPDYMPEYSDDTVSSIRYSFALKITDSEKVNITIDDVIISESDVIDIIRKSSDAYKFDSLSKDGKTLNFKPKFEGSVKLVEVITSRTVNSIMCNVRYLDGLDKVLRYDLIEISHTDGEYKVVKQESIVNTGNISTLQLNYLVVTLIEVLKTKVEILNHNTDDKSHDDIRIELKDKWGKNDLTIGGRNYLTQEEQNRIAKYSDVITTDSSLVDGLYQHKIVALTDVTIRAAIPEFNYDRFFSKDDELIVSCDIKTTEELSVKLDYSTTQEYTKVPASRWVRVSSKVKFGDRIGIYSDDRASEGTVILLKNYKLEKGNINTDWTPALEDVTDELQQLDEGLKSHTHSWNQITNKPNTFTPSTHTHTPSQVGLGNVQNFGVANQNEAQDGIVNNKYMTPLRSKQLIQNMVQKGELSMVKSVQRGFHSGGQGDIAINIATINPAKASVNLNTSMSSKYDEYTWTPALKSLTATKLTVTRSSGGNTNSPFSWEVIEYV